MFDRPLVLEQNAGAEEAIRRIEDCFFGEGRLGNKNVRDTPILKIKRHF